ncbi:MAG: Ger(x)C family spore germination protein [Symbiobacteriia bacterium]
MTRGRVLLGLALTSLALFSGCWSRTELKDVQFGLGLGVDRVPDGVQITAQFPIAAKLAGASQQGGRGGGGPGVFVTSATGSTLGDAEHRLTAILPGRPDWSNLQIIVVSEEFARQGIASLVDFIHRPQPIREIAGVLVTRGNASDVVRAANPLEPLPTMGIRQSLRAMLQQSMTTDNTLIGVAGLMGEPGVDPTLPSIDVSPEGTPRLGPLAVFKGDRLVGWLNEDETLGLAAVRGKSPHLFVILPSEEGGAPAVDVEVQSHESRVTIRMEDGQPSVDIDVRGQAQLWENNGLRNVMDPSVRHNLEQLAADRLRDEIEAAVQRSKESRADIFGFGRELYRNMPAEWRQRQKDWDEELARLDVTVNVQVTMVEGGVITEPLVPK